MKRILLLALGIFLSTEAASAESTKGVYFGSNSYGVEKRIQNIVNILKDTEVDTVAIDLKDDRGNVFRGEDLKRIIKPFRGQPLYPFIP